MRLAYYAGASTAAAAACLLKAFHQRPNFYSATVYLSQSNACLLIITNLLLVMACSFLYALQRLLYGPLRPIEIEQLSEKAWYAVLDTLLAMPSFREDVGGWLLTMFVLLLAGKVWGWIGEGRVDVLEQQPPANPRLFHLRLASSLLLSVGFALGMLKYSVESVVEDPRPGMMVIFTFEFAVLVVFSAFTLARYGLTVIEMGVVKKQTLAAIESRKSEIKVERELAKQAALTEGREPPEEEGEIEVDENEVDVPGWEEKRRYLFALEVFTDFVKLMIYIVFFTVSVTFNGLPMHIMRDVYMTFASFSKRVSDYVAYRKATSDMNTRYPDATTEEIRGDACIVCRESMVAWAEAEPRQEAPAAGQQPGAAAPALGVAPMPARRRDEGLRAKKLPCGHILHLRCLKAWLERQQVCPTCRRPVVSATAPPTTAAAGGNPPAPGQPGQPGQQPGQARPRGRIFNFGPLRVGLVNAPGGQVQNFINQLQNPEAAAAQQAQAAQQAADAAIGQPSMANTNINNARSQVPLHIQLMTLEQRIMREAHNLGLDQQQLVNLRMMEAELGRLRAQRLPDQLPVGTNGQQVPQALPQHGALPLQQMGMIGFQQPFVPTTEQLQGNPNQQLGNGHESLPAGMVLPEGWTVMPLQRVGEPAGEAQVPHVNFHTQSQPATTQSSEQSNAPSVAIDPATAIAQAAGANPPPPEQARTGPHCPTDESGSPLFVPTQQATNTSSGTEPTRTAPSHLPFDAPQALAALNPALPSPENRPAWGGESWSFGDQAEQRNQSTEVSATEAHASSNGHVPEDEHREGQHNGSYTGKGKARAVEVEDVPDKDT